MNFNALGKSEVLYNIDIAKQYDTIIVTEGAFDAINVGPNAVAILGSMISQNQISKLLKTKAKKIIMMLDPDAIDKALMSCKKLEGLIPVYLSVVEAKDPGEASRAQIDEAIADAMQYNSFTLELMSKFKK
jgi:DNA primase